MTNVVQMQELLKELRELLDELVERGKQAAQAEYEYKTEEAKSILALRADGYPATLIISLVKGNENVAKRRLKRDIAEVLYKTTQERINAVKKEIAVVSDEISREWSVAKYEEG